MSSSGQIADASILMDTERAIVAAFKAKDGLKFSESFAKSYIGIANDGFKDAAGEIAGMRNIDLRHIALEHEHVFFPAANFGIVTYTMNVAGMLAGKEIDGTIFTSSVYDKTNNEWAVVLHTESMMPKHQQD